MKIKFHNTCDTEALPPVPAHKNLPQWYKQHESYIGGKKKPNQAHTTATIKKCMPVFDMATAGYLIPLSCDIYIEPITLESGKRSHLIQWSDATGKIDWHPEAQAINHPSKSHYESLAFYPKFLNPWAIKTPKGYSCMFIEPTHRESVFNILPAIVDTDKFYGPVNFPFTMKNPDFEGLIPKGTFIVQVIPFKRDTWEIDFNDKEIKSGWKKGSEQLTKYFFDRYKKQFWTSKEHK